MENAMEVCPAGKIIVAGATAYAELSIFRVMASPATGAGADNCSVAVTVLNAETLIGLGVIAIVAGVT
jgi:hypothetical protein